MLQLHQGKTDLFMDIAHTVSQQSLSFDEQVDLAFNKIVRCAKVKEQSSKRMAAKLEQMDFKPVVIKAALDRAIRCSYINDHRYAECLIRSALSQGKGISFALKEIESLGISPDDLDAYQDYLEAGEDHAFEQALEFLNRHPSHARDLYSACCRKLVSKGYSQEIAMRAARAYTNDLVNR